MIFECGLRLFPLALLHIVAHSLYKAHSFLASGGAVERVTALRRPGPVAVPKAGAVARAFASALAIYVVVGACFGIQHKSPQAIALGAILIFGVAYLLAQGFAHAAPSMLTRDTAICAVATSVSYFALQWTTTRMTANVLPAPPAPGKISHPGPPRGRLRSRWIAQPARYPPPGPWIPVSPSIPFLDKPKNLSSWSQHG
jgi:NAD(P)H-quinone oxidoreductase subunit 5